MLIRDLSPEELICLKGELRSLLAAVDVVLRGKAKPSFLLVCKERAKQAYSRLLPERI